MSETGASKWIIAVTVIFGAFMAVMDVSVVNVAMPHMMGSFGASLSDITWVATSYSIAEIIMLTMAGWLAALMGRKRLYLLSFAVFTVGSVLAGLSQSFTQILIYRTLQGLGGGSLIPVSQAIIRETFSDEEQGMAMALYGMGVVVAPAVGPVLGGWLTDHYGWPWIFFINLPVSLIGMLLVAAFVHDPSYLRRGVQRTDWAGIGLLTIGLTGMQVVLERGQEENWFESSWIVLGTLITVAALVALVWWELRTDEPVINFRLFTNIPLAVGSLMGLFFGIGLFGSTFVLPQLTQELLGYPAFEAGLVLMPRALGLFVMMPVAGWLYRYVDARVLIGAGLILLCWSFYDLAHLSLGIDFWSLVPTLLLMGVGMPFMFVTMSTVSLSTISRTDMTEASSLYTLARRVGGNVGYAIAATVVANRAQLHRSHLMSHLVVGSPELQQRMDLMRSLGVPPQTSLAVLQGTVQRQATMLAYNDVSWLMGWMFLLTVPLIFLLPRPAPRSR